MDIETGHATLHAGLIERARRQRPRPVERPADTAERASNVVALAPGPSVDDRIRAAMPRRPRRFGLTVRVGRGLRNLLFDLREHTGRTTQSILHAALLEYVTRLEQDRHRH